MYFCHIRQRRRRSVYFIGIISCLAIIFVLHFRGGSPGTKLKRELPGITINYVQTVFLTAEQTEEEIEENFFSYLEIKDVHCRDDRRLGSLNDGGWNVCFSPPFALKQPCLVYSFGACAT